MLIALSIRQPWTELILQGRKTIEVRTWATQHRGELWLHAGIHHETKAIRRFNFLTGNLTFGALVGKCELYDCLEFSDKTWDQWRTQHLNEGPLKGRQYAWFLRNPVRILPRPLKGRLGLMHIDRINLSEKDDMGEATLPIALSPGVLLKVRFSNSSKEAR